MVYQPDRTESSYLGVTRQAKAANYGSGSSRVESRNYNFILQMTVAAGEVGKRWFTFPAATCFARISKNITSSSLPVC